MDYILHLAEVSTDAEILRRIAYVDGGEVCYIAVLEVKPEL